MRHTYYRAHSPHCVQPVPIHPVLHKHVASFWHEPWSVNRQAQKETAADELTVAIACSSAVEAVGSVSVGAASLAVSRRIPAFRRSAAKLSARETAPLIDARARAGGGAGAVIEARHLRHTVSARLFTDHE